MWVYIIYFGFFCILVDLQFFKEANIRENQEAAMTNPAEFILKKKSYLISEMTKEYPRLLGSASEGGGCAALELNAWPARWPRSASLARLPRAPCGASSCVFQQCGPVRVDLAESPGSSAAGVNS